MEALDPSRAEILRYNGINATWDLNISALEGARRSLHFGTQV